MLQLLLAMATFAGASEADDAAAALAELAATPGSLVEGDGWSVRVPERGRWQVIHYGGNQITCRGLQEISADRSLGMSVTLTICPEKAPAGDDPAAALLAAKEAEVRRYAEQDRTKIKGLTHAVATVGDRSIHRMTYRLGSLLGMPGTSGWAHYAAYCARERSHEGVCFVVNEGRLAPQRKEPDVSLVDGLIGSLVIEP